MEEPTGTRIACEIRLLGKFSWDLKLVQLRQHAFRITDKEITVADVFEQVLEMLHAQLLCEVEQRLMVCYAIFDVLDDVENGVRVALNLSSFHQA